MACCIVNQYIYIYAVQHSYCTAVCPSAAFPTILAPYKVYAGGTGHACYSPLLCLLFSTFPLSLTYDRCMRPHINFSTWLFPRHFVSLFQDKHCHLFGLLTTKKLHTGKLQHYMFFFSLPTAESQSLSEPSLLLINLFSIFRVGGKQAALTLSKSVSFSDRSLCTKGWQSCWQ